MLLARGRLATVMGVAVVAALWGCAAEPVVDAPAGVGATSGPLETGSTGRPDGAEAPGSTTDEPQAGTDTTTAADPGTSGGEADDGAQGESGPGTDRGSTGAVPDPDGGTTGEPAGPGPCSFVDDFEDADVETIWDLPQPGAVDEQDGRLVLDVNAPVSGFAQARLSPELGLQSSAARMHVGQLPQTRGVQLMLWTSANAGNQTISFKINDDYDPNLQLSVHINDGSGLGDTTELQIDYDPVAHAWLQVRHSEGMSAFEVSADGQSFTTLLELPTPFDLSAAHVGAAANNWEPLDASTEVSIDAFELDFLCDVQE